MQLSARQKESMFEWTRRILAVLGGGVLLCFANLFMVVAAIPGATFLILVFFLGCLIGMLASEVHHAVVAGLGAIAAGALILFLFVLFSIPSFVSWQFIDVLLFYVIGSLVRSLAFQVIGVLAGTVVGRIIGPSWYDAGAARHKLRSLKESNPAA
jgi:hypothetical protein